MNSLIYKTENVIYNKVFCIVATDLKEKLGVVEPNNKVGKPEILIANAHRRSLIFVSFCIKEI